MPQTNLPPVPLTPELQAKYQRFLEIGKKYPNGPERLKAVQELIHELAAKKNQPG